MATALDALFRRMKMSEDEFKKFSRDQILRAGPIRQAVGVILVGNIEAMIGSRNC